MTRPDKRMEKLNMAKAPPSFDFYPNDWIGGVQDLSWECERHYLRLICYQWFNGHIPLTKLGQMNVCGITDVGKWDQVWNELRHKFEPFDGPNGTVYFAQPRMDKDRERAIGRWKPIKESDSETESRRAAGRLGGIKSGESRREAKRSKIEANGQKPRSKPEANEANANCASIDPDPNNSAENGTISTTSREWVAKQTKQNEAEAGRREEGGVLDTSLLSIHSNSSANQPNQPNSAQSTQPTIVDSARAEESKNSKTVAREIAQLNTALCARICDAVGCRFSEWHIPEAVTRNELAAEAYVTWCRMLSERGRWSTATAGQALVLAAGYPPAMARIADVFREHVRRGWVSFVATALEQPARPPSGDPLAGMTLAEKLLRKSGAAR